MSFAFPPTRHERAVVARLQLLGLDGERLIRPRRDFRATLRDSLVDEAKRGCCGDQQLALSGCGRSRPERRHPLLDLVGLAGQRGGEVPRAVGGDDDVVLDPDADAAHLLGDEQVVLLEVQARLDGEHHALGQGALRCRPPGREPAQSWTSMPSMWLVECRVQRA